MAFKICLLTSLHDTSHSMSDFSAVYNFAILAIWGELLHSGYFFFLHRRKGSEVSRRKVRGKCESFYDLMPLLKDALVILHFEAKTCG